MVFKNKLKIRLSHTHTQKKKNVKIIAKYANNSCGIKVCNEQIVKLKLVKNTEIEIEIEISIYDVKWSIKDI
jgi:hypothetical protein